MDEPEEAEQEEDGSRRKSSKFDSDVSEVEGELSSESDDDEEEEGEDQPRETTGRAARRRQRAARPSLAELRDSRFDDFLDSDSDGDSSDASFRIRRGRRGE